MRAIVAHRLGPPEVLVLRDTGVPRPAAGEVLVRVHAVGVNFSDTERRRGAYDAPPLPWIPGNEAAGIVEAVGPGVASDWIGARVAFWASRTSGAYAEFTTVTTGALFRLREDLDFTRATALPVQGLTAYALSHASTRLEPGQRALVHAAAGGVGALLVQLLRLRGVSVFGTGSTSAKLELIRQLGAIPLPYGPALSSALAEQTEGRGVDAVFDSVGRPTQEQSLAALGRYGQLVFYGESGGSPTPIHPDALYPRNLSVSSFWLAADPPERWASARQQLQELVVGGQLRIAVDRTYPLADAAEAHRRLEDRQTLGKLVLLTE